LPSDLAAEPPDAALAIAIHDIRENSLKRYIEVMEDDGWISSDKPTTVEMGAYAATQKRIGD